MSKPAQQRPRAPAVPTGTVAIDDLFFGMETTPTASIAQPAVMPKQQQQMDPFSDFASSSGHSAAKNQSIFLVPQLIRTIETRKSTRSMR